MRYNRAMRRIAMIVLAFGIVFDGAAAAGLLDATRRGAHLVDCLTTPSRQASDWCKIGGSDEHPAISVVLPKRPDRKTRMAIGPRAVLDAWNNAAFDARSLPVFFMAGGYAETGGNAANVKWRYLARHDVFVGLTSHQTGAWSYKHPAAKPGLVLAATGLRDLIEQAAPGSEITIPPGLYGQGLFIDKSLTVKLKGARLWGVANHKAIINVKCDGCRVIIEDFHGEGRQAGCLFINCAGIKVEGRDFHLTVRRAHIEVVPENRTGS